MARKPTLRAEVEALRAELDAMREAQKSSDDAREERKSGSDGDAGDEPRQEELFGDHRPSAAEVEKAIGEFLHTVNDQIHERPRVAVAGAFVLGILIGRLSRS